MFARLCVYLFFLVAITTIVIGAPLEVSPKLTSRRALTRLAQLEKYGPPNRTPDRRAQLGKYGHLNKRTNCGHCLGDDDIYLFSFCLGQHKMAVYCAEPDGTQYYY